MFCSLYFVIKYLGPSGSGAAPLSAADGPGLETDALFTWPLPPAPVDPPRVNSETVAVKLISFCFVFFFAHKVGEEGRPREI